MENTDKLGENPARHRLHRLRVHVVSIYVTTYMPHTAIVTDIVENRQNPRD